MIIDDTTTVLLSLWSFFGSKMTVAIAVTDKFQASCSHCSTCDFLFFGRGNKF